MNSPCRRSRSDVRKKAACSASAEHVDGTEPDKAEAVRVGALVVGIIVVILSAREHEDESRLDSGCLVPHACARCSAQADDVESGVPREDQACVRKSRKPENKDDQDKRFGSILHCRYPPWTRFFPGE